MLTRILALLSLLVLAGCAPEGGTITGTAGPAVGSNVRDFTFVSPDGRQATFNRARYGVTVVAFVSAPGTQCCWLSPKVVTLADEVSDLPVSVTQILLPQTPCPHGTSCFQACRLHKAGLMSLCDAGHVAWKALGQPRPGTLILIDRQGKVIVTGTVDDPAPVMDVAIDLGNRAKENEPAGGRGIDVY